MKRIALTIFILSWGTLSNADMSGSFFTNSSLSFGTKEVSYLYKFQGLKGKVYFRQDDYGQRFEDGILFYGETGKGKLWLFKISKIHKDNLLADSVLSKVEIKWSAPLKKKILHSQEWRAGYFYLPSLFGAEEVGYIGKYQTFPADVFAFGFEQALSRPYHFPKTVAEWKVDLRGLLSFESDLNSSGDMTAAFSYLKCGLNLGTKREIATNLWLGIGYEGFFRTANYGPIIDPLQNHELSASFSFNIGERKRLDFKIYEPLKTEVISVDSLGQGRRAEAQLKINDWQFEGIWKGNYPDEEFIIQPGNCFGALVSKRFENSKISLFWNKDKEDSKAGFQLTIGQDLSPEIIGGGLKEKKATVPESPALTYYYAPETKLNLEGKSFEEVVTALDTPEKVAWYTNYFEYFDDHNDISGLFKMYTPEEVFDLKGGNCTEQSGFEAYVLSQHGYKAYNIGVIARLFTHAICIYEDETEWNALDYDAIYLAGAQNPQELLDMIYPGWFSLTIKNPSNGKSIKQIESSTKSYILDWVEGK